MAPYARLRIPRREARLTDRTFGLLRRAAACQRLTVAVISARALTNLRSLLSSDVILAGNHGMEIEGHGLRFIHEAARDFGSVLKSALTDPKRDLGSKRPQGVPR